MSKLVKVAQQPDALGPFDRGTRIIDTAIDGIVALVFGLPGDGGQKAAFGRADDLSSRHGEDEGAGAESDLYVARLAATMAIKGSLLVDERGCYRHAFDGTERGDRRADFRQRLDRHAEETAQLFVPCPLCQIHERGAARRRDIGGADAGEARKEEGIGGAEAHGAALQA